MAESPAERLAQKLRRAREFKHEVAGLTFLLKRPTDVEWYETITGTGNVGRFLPYIIGWDNVKESDVMPNGDPHPLPFDEKVRDEWLADRSDLLGPLVNAIFDSFNAHVEKRKAPEKN